MYLVRFSSTRIVEFPDPGAFERRAKRWLNLREGENTYLLSELPKLPPVARDSNVRMFTLEEENAVVAAGALFASGCLCMTWATPEMAELVAEHAVKNRWNLTNTCAPSHVSLHLGTAYADRTNQRLHVDRAERIYQLASNSYPLPADGRLELATTADTALVREWMVGFVKDAEYELGRRTADQVADALIEQGMLYLWKHPHAVAMAGWVAPTPNGACINFVYTPPAFRGQGHGKAVTAAMGARMLASGLKYCFILTDAYDGLCNHIYQSIGARTLCELLRCRIYAKAVQSDEALAGHSSPARDVCRS